MTQRGRHPRFIRTLRLRFAKHPRGAGQAFGLFLILLGGFCLLAFFSPTAGAAPAFDSGTLTPTLAPTPTFDLKRLDRPLVNDPPSQLDEGKLIFWSVCMACHGDTGQGLTDAWRDSFGEDRDCWTSKCHASNHPPQGFEFPRLVPSLAGEGRLLRFVNAKQLYEYNLAKMPWWNPGSLTEAKALAVTAYLLELNGRFPKGVTLTAANAEFIPVQYAAEPPAKELPWKILLAGAFLLAAAGIGLQSSLPRGAARPSFVLHLHPPSIPALQSRFRYTLGAGGLAVFLCLVLLVTGLLEMYYYIPSVERAAQSVQEIAFLVPFGGLVRNLHFWSAQALAVIATVHLLRVIFTGAYVKPRRFNYLLGLGLFVIALLLDFTGYVLRWDEGIRWALIAGTNLLASVPKIGEALVRFVSGNLEPGPAMLIRFYAWHIFGLVLPGGILLVWHLFRVRRDGGIAAPAAHIQSLETLDSASVRTAKSSRSIPVGPDFASAPRIPRTELLRREVIAMLIAGGILLLVATFLQAPIAQPMNASLISLTESRAPWFFLWVQELLKLGDPFLWGIAVPLGVLALLAAIPYIFPRASRSESELGRWFPRSGRAAQLVVLLLVVTILTLTILATR